MSRIYRATFFLFEFQINFFTNSREIYQVISGPLKLLRRKNSFIKKRKAITIHCQRTAYSDLPRSRSDCFETFPVFHNRFTEKNRIHLDVGLRMIRTMIDLKKREVASFIATPADFENHLLFDLIFFQPLRYLFRFFGWFICHAACVYHDQKAVLILGPTGSGKTNLALSLCRGNFGLLSDDKVILFKQKARIRCSQFFSQPKIKRECLKLFPELILDESRNKMVSSAGVKKDKFLIDYKAFEQKKTLTNECILPPEALIFPQYAKVKKPIIKKVSKKQALMRLIKEEFPPSQPVLNEKTREHIEVLKKLTQQVPACRLIYQDTHLPDIADQISEYLDNLT